MNFHKRLSVEGEELSALHNTIMTISFTLEITFLKSDSTYKKFTSSHARKSCKIFFLNWLNTTTL
ncbi:hypothetical protein CR513_03456, partial [Mucuna pruriens]